MIKIDVDAKKIDKTKLRNVGQAAYCDLILFDKPSEKSDGFVCQGQSKEDREAGKRMPIIGNWKYIGQKHSQPSRQSPPQGTQRQRPQPRDPALDPVDVDSEIPF